MAHFCHLVEMLMSASIVFPEIVVLLWRVMFHFFSKLFHRHDFSVRVVGLFVLELVVRQAAG